MTRNRKSHGQKKKKKYTRGWGVVEFVHLKIKENID
jgi:hypothetical protein